MSRINNIQHTTSFSYKLKLNLRLAQLIPSLSLYIDTSILKKGSWYQDYFEPCLASPYQYA